MGRHVLCVVILALISTSDGLQCSVMNTIQGLVSQQCPGNIMSCMKFVCRIRGSEQIYKGCNDPANPAVACQTLQSNCQAQGGTGQCYTCNHEFCNSSIGKITLLSFVICAVYLFSS